MSKLTVTLNDMRAHTPCEGSWRKLLDSLGKTQADDTPVSLRHIYDLLGLHDALWALRALPERYDGPIRLLACDFAEFALPDLRPVEVIRVARAYAVGQATDAELNLAADAAMAASIAASIVPAIAASMAASMTASKLEAAGGKATPDIVTIFLRWLDAMEGKA